MPSPEEQAYSAVERAYGQGDFAGALQQAEALQPQLQPNRSDLLDQRLQLLIGHIHLYGLGQTRQAEDAYQAVLSSCPEPTYRQLAEQSLRLCAQQTEPAQTNPESSPVSALASEPSSQPTSDLPATPWLAQLDDPQQALASIQQAWATATPAAQPAATPSSDAGTAATPWTGASTTASTETQGEAAPPPEPTPASAEPPAAVADTPAPPSDAERNELDRGLLLVRLTSRADHSVETTEPPAPEPVLPPSPETGTIHVTAPSLGAAWTLFKRHWRSYLILEGLAVLTALGVALLQLLGAGLQGLAELNPLLALLPGLALAVGAVALNLWSNLLGVSLQMLPALAFEQGSHPSATAMLQLLRRDFWRFVRAGAVVGLATGIGLLLLIVPGVLVAIATPVIIRRVVCDQQAALPAVITSVKEVGNSPAGAGLLKWELVAGLLMLGSVLLCGLPLLITIPLGGILVQQYLAHSGLGSTRI
jgi:tetratricopeptide (TPR) repeat protein